MHPAHQLVGGAGRVERALAVDGDEGAEIGVEVVDPGQVLLEQLDRTGVARPDGGGLRAGVVPDHERPITGGPIPRAL